MDSKLLQNYFYGQCSVLECVNSPIIVALFHNLNIFLELNLNLPHLINCSLKEWMLLPEKLLVWRAALAAISCSFYIIGIPCVDSRHGTSHRYLL
jgi:hypothetical protein